tara:strand:- start:336 stop:539 length:204 start_codon:yes stop_codon:yes gene_type:complete
MLQYNHNQLNAEILFDVINTIGDNPTEQTYIEQVCRLTELEHKCLHALLRLSPQAREDFFMKGYDDE